MKLPTKHNIRLFRRMARAEKHRIWNKENEDVAEVWIENAYPTTNGLTEAETFEKERLLSLRQDNTRHFTREEHNRLFDLLNKSLVANNKSQTK